MMGDDLDAHVREYIHRIAESPVRTTVTARDIARENDASREAIGHAIPRVARDNPEITLVRVTAPGNTGRWEVSIDAE